MSSPDATRDLRALIERGSPFAVTLGPSVVSVDGGTVVLDAETPPSLDNHVGGPHAATLFGFGETAAAGVVVSVFRDLVEQGVVPLIKSAEISYTALTLGAVRATATFVGDEAGVRDSVARRGVAVFPVEVAIGTQDGAQTATMRAEMTLKRM